MPDWYKEWFLDARYLQLYKNRNDDEANELISLIEKITGSDKSRSILDIPCGAARHLITLAERGYTNLHGRDLSASLIAEANTRISATGLAIEVAIADIRDTLEGEYDLILNLFTSFGYFEDDSEHEAVLRSFASALRASGYIVIDFLNAQLVKDQLVGYAEIQLEGGEVAHVRKRIESGRVIKSIRFASDGKEFIESVRLYTIDDFREMFERFGIVVEHTFGDYQGNAFTDTSSRLIMFARRK